MSGQSNLSYREAQERFISGHGGGSLQEIALLVSIAPAAVLLRQLLYLAAPPLRRAAPLCRFLADFSLLVLPLLLITTLLSPHVTSTLVLTLAAATPLALYTHLGGGQSDARSQDFVRSDQVSLGDNGSGAPRPPAWLTSQLYGAAQRRPFLTAFRAYVNIATAVVVLGVDFPVFPRRLAKTETYGTGLMDVGVGAFVVSNALVSAEARGGGHSACRIGGQSAVRRIVRSLVSTLPLWVLGVGRLVSLKATNYQEHVSEYGVHWNFFFTLAVVRVLSSILFSLVPPSLSGPASLVLGSAYQWTLSCPPLSLAAFILLGSDGQGGRGDGLLSANREGLCSCLGYLAIYCAGVELGRYLHRPRSSVSDWLRVFVVLALVDALLWALLSLSSQYIDLVSRRMANLPYIIWMMAYNIQLLVSFLLVDLVQSLVLHGRAVSDSSRRRAARHQSNADVSNQNEAHVHPDQSDAAHKKKAEPQTDAPLEDAGLQSELLDAVNENGLFYFLLANLLTGAVNFSVETIHVGAQSALVMLVCYLLLLSGTAALLHTHRLHVKFW